MKPRKKISTARRRNAPLRIRIRGHVFVRPEVIAKLSGYNVRTLANWRSLGVGPTPTHHLGWVYYGLTAFRRWDAKAVRA